MCRQRPLDPLTRITQKQELGNDYLCFCLAAAVAWARKSAVAG
jgi:hypothetical protein